MKKINFIKFGLFSGLLILGTSCTNLDEKIIDGYAYTSAGGGTVDTPATLQAAYEGLRAWHSQGTMFALGEVATDALAGPTRGGDWDDNGAWRQVHTQTWASDHGEVKGAYTSLLSSVYNCNLVVDNSTNASEIAQARFLRAFYYYHVIDLFGQAPYRPAKTELSLDALVYTRQEATAFVIKELEEVIGALPTLGSATMHKANQDAAHFLLAKLYLNKAVFNSPAAKAPFTFDAADMNKVVEHVDAMTASLTTDYWDNFSATNSNSTEVVFATDNVTGETPQYTMESRWRMSSHYKQTPGGWNGFAIVSDYYDTFDPTDRRIHNTDPAVVAAFGNSMGFQIGQQYEPGGVNALKDRNGNDLVFTKALTLITSGETLETAGIRQIKYIPDTGNMDRPGNDLVLMRYADALLMKSEAIVRGAGAGAGLSVATIKSKLEARTAPAVVNIDLSSLDGIYKARGNEMWLEGYRRNDMIRFGTFLNERALKPYVSEDKYLLYPIPADGLLNPNIKQNPGY